MGQRPAARAKLTASRWLRTPSLVRMLRWWVQTVLVETTDSTGRCEHKQGQPEVNSLARIIVITKLTTC